MGETRHDASELDVSEKTLQDFRRLGVIAEDGTVSGVVLEFMSPDGRSTATEEELLEFLEEYQDSEAEPESR